MEDTPPGCSGGKNNACNTFTRNAPRLTALRLAADAPSVYLCGGKYAIVVLPVKDVRGAFSHAFIVSVRRENRNARAGKGRRSHPESESG